MLTDQAISPRRGPVVGSVAAILGLGMVAGCTRSISQAEIKFLETREIRRPYETTYDAAVNALFSMGMTILHSDKGSGVVSGQSGDYGQRAELKGKKRREYQVRKVTLLITPHDAQRTRVRVKMLINEEQQLDRRLVTEIWQRIEREAMLDAAPSRSRSSARRRP